MRVRQSVDSRGEQKLIVRPAFLPSPIRRDCLPSGTNTKSCQLSCQGRTFGNSRVKCLFLWYSYCWTGGFAVNADYREHVNIGFHKLACFKNFNYNLGPYPTQILNLSHWHVHCASHGDYPNFGFRDSRDQRYSPRNGGQNPKKRGNCLPTRRLHREGSAIQPLHDSSTEEKPRLERRIQISKKESTVEISRSRLLWRATSRF